MHYRWMVTSALLLASLFSYSRGNDSISQHLSISIQWNNWVQLTPTIDDFYYDSLWHSQASAKKQTDKAYSFGLGAQYNFVKPWFLRCHLFYTYKSASSSLDTNETPYQRSAYSAEQKKFGLALGSGLNYAIKKMDFYAGAQASLIMSGNFKSDIHHEIYNASACGWGLDYISSYSFQGENCYGLGAFGGLNWRMHKHFGLGAEVSYHYLFTHLKAGDNPDIKVNMDCAQVDPHGPAVIFDKRISGFSKPGVEAHLVYVF